jgi:PAS domain S-box-containing protein
VNTAETERRATKAPTLRQRAEARLASAAAAAEAASETEVRRLVHELQVHQVELEIQNQELLCTQQALVNSRSRYVALFEFAPIGYVTLDVDTTIREANWMAAELLGVERSALIGEKLAHFVLPGSQDAFHLHRQDVDHSGNRQSCELEFRQQNGTRFTAQVDTVRIADSEDKPGSRHYRCAISDISNRKLTEATLRSQADELTLRNLELQQLNRAMIGREMFIIELKKQVNELSRQLGLGPAYSLDFLEDGNSGSKPENVP